MRKGDGGLVGRERLDWMVTRACGWERAGTERGGEGREGTEIGSRIGGGGWWWRLRMARDVGECLTLVPRGDIRIH